MGFVGTHYFIAISVDKIRPKLRSIQREVDTSLFKHAVYPDDFHITLEFLGEATEEQLTTLDRYLKDVTASLSSFEISTTGIGTFGKVTQPRVIYVGVNKENNIVNLHNLVVESCQKAGFKTDKREYRPHITLAKKWRYPEKKIGRNLPELDTLTQQIDHIGIYRVEPSEKPRYKCIQRYEISQ